MLNGQTILATFISVPDALTLTTVLPLNDTSKLQGEKSHQECLQIQNEQSPTSCSQITETSGVVIALAVQKHSSKGWVLEAKRKTSTD